MTEREKMHVSRRGEREREREREREFPAGSAVSVEPDMGLELMNHEIMT